MVVEMIKGKKPDFVSPDILILMINKFLLIIRRYIIYVLLISFFVFLL